MTKTETILQTGKQIAAIAAGRAFRGKSLKTHPEEVLNDPAAEKQQDLKSGHGTPAENDGRQDPGNPNEVDHDGQDPGQLGASQ